MLYSFSTTSSGNWSSPNPRLHEALEIGWLLRSSSMRLAPGRGDNLSKWEQCNHGDDPSLQPMQTNLVRTGPLKENGILVGSRPGDASSRAATSERTGLPGIRLDWPGS